MAPFDYVMTLVSVVVGLALTHILGAFGVAVQRLRGHGAPIRLEAVYLCWVAFLLVWLISFWWWEYKLHEIAIRWTYGTYLFILGYAVILFLMAVILVPKNMAELHDSYDYFMGGRRWFFVTLMIANVVDVADSWLKGSAWALRWDYLVQVAAFFLGALIAIRAKSRTVQLWNAAALLTAQLIYTWIGLDVLGSW